MVLTGVMKEIPNSVKDTVVESVRLIEEGNLKAFDQLVSPIIF